MAWSQLGYYIWSNREVVYFIKVDRRTYFRSVSSLIVISGTYSQMTSFGRVLVSVFLGSISLDLSSGFVTLIGAGEDRWIIGRPDSFYHAI